MGIILTKKIEGPAAWTGKGLSKDDSWIHYLSEKTIASLEYALNQVLKKGLKAPDFTKEDFPIQDLSDEINYRV
ncbi:hypothetical protein JMM81_13700 [Bacillus sp. V3B]|uniref:hypothetical protein n=1 Tax=Bacillus sp. V3B TaxID=2804915 RepID=UPI002109D520|nr:hypothetical protein [Bacillus sp. V3B]MCQ6275993.1 hypothetical protein [Bacillus sp. V3B]